MKRYSILLSAVTLLAMIIATTTPAKAAFPGANGYIVFGSDRDNYNQHRIYRMDPDGTDQTQLTFGTYDGSPAWSPDGTRIAFTSKRDYGGGGEIYVMNADGTGQTRLTNNPAYDSNPEWSPDGTRIVFESNRDSNYEIYVMNADGSNQTRLTNNSAYDATPSWSPDGTKIAFMSFRDGNYEIYVMNADGSNPTNLTNNPYSDGIPDWSPDGTKIVFESTRYNDQGQIYVMNADGSGEPIRLTGTTYGNSRAVWSPDGTKIAFYSYRDEEHWGEIYVMDEDGSNQTRLTDTPNHNYSPSWQPIPLFGDCPQEMVAFWKFDEINGDTAYDSVSINHGTLHEGPEWTTGIVGGALSFDGLGDYVTVPHSDDITFGTARSYSVEAWVYPISLPDAESEEVTIIGKGIVATGFDYCFDVFYYQGNQRFYVDSDSAAYYALPLNAWSHIVTTFASPSTHELYINGVQIPIYAQATDHKQAGTDVLWMGSWQGTGRFFEGKIDEVAIYDRLLTPEEIHQHYIRGLYGEHYCTTNEPPVADANGPYLVAVNSTIPLEGSASDPDGDALYFSWGATAGSFDNENLEDPVYNAGSEAGIFDLTLTVTDGDLSASDATFVVVYDPSGGFVTGGGWIYSPAGAYAADLALTGKANFGFVSKYKKGATVPTGKTEFNFKAGDLNFHSDTYEWLVVNQDDTNAQFKGSGTINGEGYYEFMLWAGDGDPDTFRIRIWEEVEESGDETDVYDNGFDQAIGGGSIKVHAN